MARYLLPLVVLCALAACSDSDSPTAPPPPTQVPAVSSVVVSPASISVLEGETTKFRAVVRNAQGEEIAAPGLVWRSADPTIAQVDASGTAIALTQHGTTQIIAEVGGKQASGALTSKARCSSPAPVHGTRVPGLPLTIVKTRDGVNVERVVRNLTQKYGFEVVHIYEAVYGFSARLSEIQTAQLRCERDVLYLQFDAEVAPF